MTASRLLPLFLFLAFSLLSLMFSWYLKFSENMCLLQRGCEINPGRHSSIPDDLLPANRQLCSGLDNSSEATKSPNLFDEEEEGKMSRISLDLRHRQHERKKVMQDLCSNIGTFGYLKEVPFYDIPNDQLENLLVDDRNGIVYCYIPKVACSEWKRLMIFLSQSLKDNGVPYRNLSEIPSHVIHENVTHLKRDAKEVMQCKIEKYKKFLFVRNPFVRLISVYRDKFEIMNEIFYRYYAVPILKKYGTNAISVPDDAGKAHEAGIRPSFSQFIQYILDLEDKDASEYQEHWRQMHKLCHPCQIQYDFVGKMETIQEDAQHLLQLLKVDHIVHFPPKTGQHTEESWINAWYSGIPYEWRRKLYKIYKADFKLFGYSLPKNFLNANHV